MTSVDDSFAQLTPDSAVDQFRIRRLIGEGATAWVYLARDIQLGRRVALKLLKKPLSGSQERDLFLHEARTTARFNHPNIVTVYAIGEYRSHPYIALEFVQGRSLRDSLRAGTVPPRESMRIGLDVCHALVEAHRHEIVHYDLRPENVVIPPDGRTRVLDFGLAALAKGVPKPGEARGTVPYMAPEAWRGLQAHAAADIWALGIMLFELSHGSRPYPDHLLFKYAYAAWPPVSFKPGVDDDFKQVISSCLKTDPAERPSAEELAEQLREILEKKRSISPAVRASPFPGLRCFEERDTFFYFGREDEIAAAIERLRSQSILPVAGPSGVGKSSFVRAGLIPRLAESAEWTTVTLRPGKKPMENLVRQVVKLAIASGYATEQEVTLLSRLLQPGKFSGFLHDYIRSSGGGLVLFVDQLEEIYGNEVQQEEIDQFIRALSEVADDPLESLRIIFTIRDDFIGRCAATASMQRAMTGMLVLRPLDQAGLIRATVGPIQRLGYAIDDRSWVERTAKDLESSPAQLPLLQFACELLWQKRDAERRLLSTAELDKLGGVGGALAQHADSVVASLSEQSLALTKQILLRLMHPAGTRRTVSIEALVSGLPESSAAVVEELRRARLIVVSAADGVSVVDLAHDSLFITWPSLRRWFDESRQEHLFIEELKQAAELWRRRDQPTQLLWPDDRLAERIQVVGLALPPAVETYVRASVEHQRRSARRKRLGFIGAGFVMSLTTAVALFVAAAFAEKERETRAQSVEIGLAAADMGRFELVLRPFERSESSTRAVDVAKLSHLSWELRAPESVESRVLASSTGSRLRSMAGTDVVYLVEARSGPAALVIKGRGENGANCAPSRIELDSLPGYSSRERAELVRIIIHFPTCSESERGLILIPGGPYIHGGLGEPPVRHPEYAEPERQVTLEAYLIDQTEVTNAAYSMFARGAGKKFSINYPKAFESLQRPNHPVSGINATAAEAYCKFMGKRLPASEEWEKAARGGLTLDLEAKVKNPLPRRNYPWGEAAEIPANLLGDQDGFDLSAPVGSFPAGASPYGVLDLAGNVYEWTASPADDGSGMQIIRGGDWDTPADAELHSIALENPRDPRHFSYSMGFRCAVSPAAP